MLTVFRNVGMGDALPGQPWLGLSPSQLISCSNSVAEELTRQRDQDGLRGQFQGFLAGPVSLGIMSQGLEECW